MMSKIASVAILSATLAAAQDTYPDARGPCFPTQGGDNSCGPNGSEDWLNSGLEGDRWNPPFLDINSLAYISTEDFYNGVGGRCRQYDEYFQNSGRKYNIDPPSWLSSPCRSLRAMQTSRITTARPA